MKTLTFIILQVIKGYRLFILPYLPRSCRFYPSCSQYAEEVIEKYGAKGILLSIGRLLKCTPFHPGGYDPVR